MKRSAVGYIGITVKNTVCLKDIIAIKENRKGKNKRKATRIVLDGGEIFSDKSAASIIKRINALPGVKIYEEE